MTHYYYFSRESSKEFEIVYAFPRTLQDVATQRIKDYCAVNSSAVFRRVPAKEAYKYEKQRKERLRSVLSILGEITE